VHTRHPDENAPSVPKLPARRRPQAPAALSGLLLLVAFHTMADPVANTARPVQAVVPQAPDSSLPEVTVQAKRAAIEPRVHSFVYDSLYLENDEGTARWNSPVCPEVVGLSHDQGEFILARLSQVARAAGVPLAGVGCSPANLAVFATAEPASFLKKWSKARHYRMFGDGTRQAVNAFIDTPRPVRVWYNSSEAASTGTMRADVHQLLGLSMGGNATQAPAFVGSGGDSHVTRLVTWSLTSVIIVVDDAQLHGVKLQQLADYIGMYAFARLKPGAQQGDAPTILGLFQGDASRSPPGLTPWDEAFLEALYHTNPALVLQRGIMVRRMVSHIVPEASP
jgi:hypothetical protein